MADQNPNQFQQHVSQLSSVKVLTEWWDRFKTNTGKSFSDMSPKDYIRLIIIVCTYLLIRPYLLKLGAHVQKKQLEKEERRAEEERKAREGGLNANDLRGGRKIEIPGVESEDEDEEEVVVDATTGERVHEWGRKARVRQRKFIRKTMEEHERRLAEKATESDQEIEDLLEE